MTGRKSSGPKSKSAASRSAAVKTEPARRVTTPVPPPPMRAAAANSAPVPDQTTSAPPMPGVIPETPDREKAKTVEDITENTAPEMKKQELMAKVVERSGVAKKHAKPVIEAILEVLGEAIGEGRGLNLQPFGKLKHNRIKDTPAARVIIAKIRQPKDNATRPPMDKEAVADTQE